VDFYLLAALAVTKALGLRAAGYSGTKLAQKAFGDGIKKNKKKDKEAKEIWTRNKIYRKKSGNASVEAKPKSGLSNIEISDIMKNEKNFRGVFAIDMLLKKLEKMNQV
jgi:hypothetical protein